MDKKEFEKNYLVNNGTAYLRKNEKTEPSRVEDFLSAVSETPNPPDEELHVGSQPLADQEKITNAILDRKKIFDLADTIFCHRVQRQKIELLGNVLLNDGFNLSKIQKIAAVDSSKESVYAGAEIFASAGIIFPTIEDTEALIAVARAILLYTNTYHHTTQQIETIDQIKTPFMAWRVKETVQDYLLRSEPVQTSEDGYDSMKQVKEFYANFNITDIVLWNKDIWQAATRGHRFFKGTKITDDIINAAKPMFWQYDRKFTTPSAMSKIFDKGVNEILGQSKTPKTHECVGFVILPTTEKMVQLSFPEECVEDIKPGKEDEFLIRVEYTNPETKKILYDALNNPELKFDARAISIAIILMPVEGKPIPEIRFFKPIVEGEEIKEDFYTIFLAAIKFLTLKYVSQDNAQVSKKELKQDRALFKKVRKGKVQISPIKIINLRKPEKRERTQHEEEEAQKRQYNCHFLVDAHWRSQYYPSEKTHKVIRILGYVKGDVTKPFKAPREKVYKAVR